MIVKRYLNLFKVALFLRKEVMTGVCFSFFAYYVYIEGNVVEFALPFSMITVLGSAIAILLGFHSSSCYNRWWEARQNWGVITAQCRIFSRLIITLTDGKKHLPTYNAAKSNAFKTRVVRRLVAWANALRLHLREQNTWSELEKYLSEEEMKVLSESHNKPATLLHMQGNALYEGLQQGILQGFDSLSCEASLAALTNMQANCERTKWTPFPRVYDFFTFMFTFLFLGLMPFCLLSLWPRNRAYMIFPMSIIVSFMYGTIVEAGTGTQNPFNNLVSDVPLSYCCAEIERDALEALGEDIGDADLSGLEPKNGYLY